MLALSIKVLDLSHIFCKISDFATRIKRVTISQEKKQIHEDAVRVANVSAACTALGMISL